MSRSSAVLQLTTLRGIKRVPPLSVRADAGAKDILRPSLLGDISP
jgi:hypothetical protein